MLKATYTYSFNELSGKPKRYLESKPGCKLMGYGVSMDTVTLCVLYDSQSVYDEISLLLKSKFKLFANNIKTL